MAGVGEAQALLQRGMTQQLQIPSASAPSTSAALRVLIAEDCLPERMRLRAMLERLGHQVHEAGDGDAAWAYLQQEPVDLVISDWCMPGRSGLELCADLPAHTRPYFILLTGRNAGADLVAGMDAGADDFIVKPVAAEELRVRVQAGARIVGLNQELARRNAQLALALKQEQEHLAGWRSEAEEAARLQAQLQPRQPPPGLTLWSHQQAGHVVSGDLLGCELLAEDQALFYLADLCGHGLAAAMQAFAVNERIGRLCRRHAPNLEAGMLLGQVNQTLCQQAASTSLFSMAVAHWQANTGCVDIALAGHPQLLLVSPDASAQWVGQAGLLGGVRPHSDYSAQRFVLAPGAQLIMYSDGLFDGWSDHGQSQDLAEQFRQRFVSASPSLASTQSIIQNWLQEHPSEDDVSVLVVQRDAH